MEINWMQKLSSRKFWAAFAAWITSLLTAFDVGENVIARVSVILAGIGALAVYMLAEAKADVAKADAAKADAAKADAGRKAGGEHE